MAERYLTGTHSYGRYPLSYPREEELRAIVLRTGALLGITVLGHLIIGQQTISV